MATGKVHTLGDFIQASFKEIGVDNWEEYVGRDERYYRPADVFYLAGNASKANEAAKSLKLPATVMKKLNIIDEIIQEPLGGAHRDYDKSLSLLGDSIELKLNELLKLDPKELKIIHDSVRSLASETFTSVSAPIQYAAVKAYTEDHSEYLNNSRIILKKVADFVYDQLSELGIECIRPQGGFYILCDFSKIIKNNNMVNNATSLCEQVLQNTGFAMLPGKNFGIEDEKLIT